MVVVDGGGAVLVVRAGPSVEISSGRGAGGSTSLTVSASAVVDEINGAMVVVTASTTELIRDETEKCSDTDLSTVSMVSQPS